MNAWRKATAIDEIVSQLLIGFGWSVFKTGAALASKMYQTAVGNKEALTYLGVWGSDAENFVLSGEYWSEGSNCLESRFVFIPKVADRTAVEMLVKQFVSNADAAVSQTYAVKVLHARIHARLDELTQLATERQRCCDGIFAATMGGAAIDFMTPEELRERHELLLQLPSQAEEREAAQLRIQVRIAERKAKQS